MSTNSSRKTFNTTDSGGGKSGPGGYNKLGTDPKSSTGCTPKREPAHTVSGHDLSKYLKKEKQYAGVAPMERFLRESGSNLERQLVRKVPKGLL